MSDDAKELKDALGAAISSAATDARVLAGKYLTDLEGIGGEAAVHGRAVAAALADAVKEVAAGKVSADVASDVVARYLAALGEVAGAASEAAAQASIRRAKEGLTILAQVGIAAARLAIAAAL